MGDAIAFIVGWALFMTVMMGLALGALWALWEHTKKLGRKVAKLEAYATELWDYEEEEK